MFCVGDESIDHLLFGCPLPRFVWGISQVAFDTGPAPNSLEEVDGWINRFHGLDLTVAKKKISSYFLDTLENHKQNMF